MNDMFFFCYLILWVVCRTRLVAVAAQKFISDIASDSLQHCKARVAAPIKDNKSKQPKDRRLVLTMDDLSKALREVNHFSVTS
ncbi:unnamed protein product [Triticum turgidum subsp. durum]|uniref:Uncharacterized protein n=1 Tax=Triticum turgidum subsp. durum TaxID=4567 RepID=A0A9R0ZVF3_TRITD|nr:unnamed protein product [Triticum turgidum subsp. durum]